MVAWSWEQFFKQNQNNSFLKVVSFTYDDRWVPFRAFLDLLSHGVTAESINHQFHIDGAEDIHFLNVVGINDMLVKPSSSIIEFESPVPREFKSFKQMILDAGHFMFCSPCYTEDKIEIAQWFAGNSFTSLLRKIKNEMSVDGCEDMIRDHLLKGYKKGTTSEKKHFVDDLNAITNQKSTEKDINILAKKAAEIIVSSKDSESFYELQCKIVPIVEKSIHRK